MTDILQFKVSGFDTLNARLAELGVELGVKALAMAARKAFMPVLKAAQSLVPVNSGALRNAIKLTVKKPKGEGAVVVVGLYISSKNDAQGLAAARAFGQKPELPPSRRWHFVELGTAHMAAHPYLRPALDANASRVLEALKSELVKSIEKVSKQKAAGPK